MKVDNNKISVVMSVYNGERFLRSAIESILSQTLREFEFIIINDGSSDSSEAIIKSYKDDRIKLINQSNRGLAFALNKGIRLSKGKYIARMDDDDISLPERLGIQYEFLENNPEYGVVGTLAKYITEDDEYLSTSNLPETDAEIRKKLPLFWFHHGGVLMRKDVLIEVGLYDEWARKTEDLLLWNRIATESKLYVIQKPLYQWRFTISGGTNVCKNKATPVFLSDNSKRLNYGDLVSKVKQYYIIAEHDEKHNSNSIDRRYQYNSYVAINFLRIENKKNKALKYIMRSVKTRIIIQDIFKFSILLILPVKLANRVRKIRSNIRNSK